MSQSIHICSETCQCFSRLWSFGSLFLASLLTVLWLISSSTDFSPPSGMPVFRYLSCNYLTCKRCTVAPQIGVGPSPLRGLVIQSTFHFLRPFYFSWHQAQETLGNFSSCTPNPVYNTIHNRKNNEQNCDLRFCLSSNLFACLFVIFFYLSGSEKIPTHF